MSSSKGLGVSARDMADFLPPELLRFLMIRPKPNKPVNFDPDETSITKLFNEYDRYHHKVTAETPNPEDKRIYQLSDIYHQGDYYAESFQVVTALVQMPHLDVEEEVAKRKGAALTTIELDRLRDRIRAVNYWLKHYASDDELLVLQDHLPGRASELTATQCAFLHDLAERLRDVSWDEDSIQALTFESARATPIRQPLAFAAIYRVLLDKKAGPKAGNLLAYLDREFVIRRFLEPVLNRAEYLQESAMDRTAFETWLAANEASIIVTEVDPLDESGFKGMSVTYQKDERAHRLIVSGNDLADLASSLVRA